MMDDDWLDERHRKSKKSMAAPKELNESELRRKAVELLARREYSFAELEKKLLPLSSDETLVYNALDWMVENGLQSDQRFATMYVRSKALSGYGPIRIRMELKQKGVSESLMELAFDELANELDWIATVDQQIEKKSRNLDLADPKDKNKLMGYMQRRGFSLDQIYSGLDRRKYIS
ncbi:regulatory protein RecX [Bermanella marisrubri]|uniref:Regulatory protein RecX n=1 Tax=Bermanella marisrubri TaxID=207949 RepID=Q1MYV7_9GAMM|nr:regulatory protein RecX [Bermanella marisrubri]EAT11184.1 Regulatory protein RecX [Oceanobacter sp. RED65] [Bermanella marisrubri]QIZ83367.1 regulatory protein RecX [Bermanella marisrubri]